ncbi:hypothetical protein B0O99DRAFT_592665 [Bisporella sp. PMI_857]|nr:hypothetical protein B0O99DRAFT_592665 [Bisporella sp. PMI_857]
MDWQPQFNRKREVATEASPTVGFSDDGWHSLQWTLYSMLWMPSVCSKNGLKKRALRVGRIIAQKVYEYRIRTTSGSRLTRKTTEASVTWVEPPPMDIQQPDTSFRTRLVTDSLHGLKHGGASSYKQVYGDLETALYHCGSVMEASQTIDQARIRGVEVACESDSIDPAKFFNFFERMPVPPDDHFNQSLRRLCLAMEVYENILSIIISLQVINDALWKARQWILIRAPKHTEIRRVIGTVGHSGIAMLIPPTDLLIRKSNCTQYWFVNHDKFDGSFVSKFPRTQMELSFTGWEQFINSRSRWGYDSAGFFLETMVKMHGAATLFAAATVTVDLMALLGQIKLSEPTEQGSVNFEMMGHRAKINDEASNDMSKVPDLIAIGNWEELLWRQPKNIIVNATFFVSLWPKIPEIDMNSKLRNFTSGKVLLFLLLKWKFSV